MLSTFILALKLSYNVQILTIALSFIILNKISTLVHGHPLIPVRLENDKTLQAYAERHAPLNS